MQALKSPRISNREAALTVYTETLRNIFLNQEIKMKIETNEFELLDSTTFKFYDKNNNEVGYFHYSCEYEDNEIHLQEGIKDREKLKGIPFLKLMLVYAVIQCEKQEITLQAWGSDPFHQFSGQKEERQDSGASLIVYYESIGFKVKPNQNIKIDENGKFSPVDMTRSRNDIILFLLNDKVSKLIGRVKGYLESIVL